MKTTRFLIVLFSAMAAVIASAQTVQIVVLSREVDYVQTTAGTASLNGATPYTTGVFINGTSLNLLTSMSFKKPGDAVTVYSGAPNGSEWQAPTSGNLFGSMAAVHSAFGAGAYTISVSGFSDSSLTMTNLVGTTNDGLPNMPFITGTQGGNPVTWSGGKMMVDPTMALTLDINNFTTNFTNGLGRVGIGVFGNIPDQEASNETAPGSFVFSGSTAQLVIAANTFTAGQTYSGDMEFDNILSAPVDLSSIYGGTAKGVVVYAAFTSFQIQAIPEPSTYAAIFGAVVLAGVMLHSRRRQIT